MLVSLINMVIVLVLGVAGVFCSGHPFVVIALTGVLLMLLTAGSLCDETSKTIGRALRITTLLLIVAFAFAGGGWWAFLAFACTDGISIPLSAICASVGCAVYTIVSTYPGTDAKTVAEMILYMAVTALLVSAVRLVKRALEDAGRREALAEERLIKTSLSEMKERRINRELSRQSYEIDRNARLLERETISRNIHNSVGHTITAAIMTLDAADMLYETKPEEARRRMNDANERIRGSLDSIRSAVRALDEESRQLPIADLERYLRNAAEDFTMDTERTVDVVVDRYATDITVPKEHVEFLTGVLQEALTNGVKHGGAMHYTVTLSADSAHVRLRVRDDGKSDFDDAVRDRRLETGFGLRKILSYAERCGGTACFENDGGFCTEVELPL